MVVETPVWQMCGLPLGEWLSHVAVQSAARAAERAVDDDFECIKKEAMKIAKKDEWVNSQRNSFELPKTAIDMCPALIELLERAHIRVTNLDTTYHFSWGRVE